MCLEIRVLASRTNITADLPPHVCNKQNYRLICMSLGETRPLNAPLPGRAGSVSPKSTD